MMDWHGNFLSVSLISKCESDVKSITSLCTMNRLKINIKARANIEAMHTEYYTNDTYLIA